MYPLPRPFDENVNAEKPYTLFPSYQNTNTYVLSFHIHSNRATTLSLTAITSVSTESVHIRESRYTSFFINLHPLSTVTWTTCIISPNPSPNNKLSTLRTSFSWKGALLIRHAAILYTWFRRKGWNLDTRINDQPFSTSSHVICIIFVPARLLVSVLTSHAVIYRFFGKRTKKQQQKKALARYPHHSRLFQYPTSFYSAEFLVVPYYSSSRAYSSCIYL